MTPPYRGHLGSRVSAYVDDALAGAERDAARRHLEECHDCRVAVTQERFVQNRLQALPGAEPSAALLLALQSVGCDGARRHATAAAGARAMDPHSDPTTQWRLPRPRHARLLLAGAGSVSAGLLGLAYVVGGTTAQPAPVVPPVEEFSAEFAGQGEPLPFADPAAGITAVLDQSWPQQSGR
jgi:anti-sigma factor RsiW